jgi:hypothetical protein
MRIWRTLALLLSSRRPLSSSRHEEFMRARFFGRARANGGGILLRHSGQFCVVPTFVNGKCHFYLDIRVIESAATQVKGAECNFKYKKEHDAQEKLAPANLCKFELKVLLSPFS